ncbi:hypothetical protein OBBRIDRAFT_725379 [Obba rivulosa]|uniref:Spindle pole body component n=1 Tax=Obba rivulosa TaxID=1052685 RepID=A0A8E2DM06_9APHY|nr:hypothetical protein OBBRIDRAFT_725379 [Obba rivulosa]
MLESGLVQLPLQPDGLVGLCVEALPEIAPQFHVPALADKPQNPIVDTLKLVQDLNVPPQTPNLPNESEILTEDICATLQRNSNYDKSLWWTQALRNSLNTNQLKTWDALRPSFNNRASASPFLSEQSSHTFAAARYYVRPALSDPTVHLIYTTPSELFNSLRVTLTGTSSALHIWDSQTHSFRFRNALNHQRGVIIIVGTDEIVSASFTQRFFTIGTLMRRIEIMINEGRQRLHQTYRSDEPVSHALMHALSSVLTYSRHLLNTLPLAKEDNEWGDAVSMTASWVQYAELEELLRALSAFCHREEHLTPRQYGELPMAVPELLSHIYQTLEGHYSRRAPRIVLAVFAFILTVTSRDYFQQLGQSVGYGNMRPMKDGTASVLPMVDGAVPALEEQDIGQNDDVLQETSFPTFVDPSVAEALPRARKSLALLRRAQPDHPLLTRKNEDVEITWLWTQDEVEAAWEGTRAKHSHYVSDQDTRSSVAPEDTSAGAQTRLYPPELTAFTVFDLPPGEFEDTRLPHILTSEETSSSSLSLFTDAFPSTLPAITPTLPHLSRLIISPLVQHVEALSGALVDLLLLKSSYFSLHAHLVLLRSYLLITSDSFKLRLRGALLSDSDDYEAAPVGTRAFARRSRSQSRSKSNNSSSNEGPWAVGISSTLTEGRNWPPGGADLSFNLRTVIIDSLGRSSERDLTGPETVNDRAANFSNTRIVEEAEYRLGFALRDLPVGTGRAKWLNPLCTPHSNSMDFLYMDYRAPQPLDVVISPVVLSKYHRLFTFSLRLMRVENATWSLFRMTRRSSEPLFQTLTGSNKLLLHFRFVAHSFITALSSYVYDTAIGGNFDAFLAKLNSESQTSKRTFMDVFALAEHHSRIMDDILSACLLRSSQRAVGDLLRACLQCILDLAVLAGELKRGRLQEYEVVPLLEDLWHRFRSKMTSLIQSLRALVDKGAGSTGVPLEDIRLQSAMGPLSQVEGLTRDLHNLLVRLDVSEWWIDARV